MRGKENIETMKTQLLTLAGKNMFQKAEIAEQIVSLLVEQVEILTDSISVLHKQLDGQHDYLIAQNDFLQKYFEAVKAQSTIKEFNEKNILYFK